MNTTAVAPKADALESVLIQGDLSRLTPEQRVAYYKRVCESLRLNPLTRPFEYLELNRKLVLYAKRDCTEQLRERDGVSVAITARELVEGVYVVTAQAKTPSGRTDESIGAVAIEGLKGENRANAMMKAETKAKRRVTLSVCGLGMLDETEVESVPHAPQSPPPKALPQPQPAPVEQNPDANDPYPDRLEFSRELTRTGRDWPLVMSRVAGRFNVAYTASTRWSEVQPDHLRYALEELRKLPDEPAKV